MARSAQRNKRKPPQRPRSRPDGRPKRAAPPPRSYEDEMFFPRLRRQAKWMFVVLALVFGLGYVIFNVGGTIPGTGLGDILQNAGGADGLPDVGDAEEKVRENPKSPEAKLELADAYSQNDRPDDAIPVLEDYLELRPKDADVVSRVAGLYMGQGARHRQEAALAQAEVEAAAPGTQFAPASGLVTQLRAQGEVSNEASLSFQQARDTYKKLGELTPDDSSVQFSLAQAAEQAGDYATAITAYKRFIKLAPDDPNVPAIRDQIKLLEQQLKLQSQIQPTGGSSG